VNRIYLAQERDKWRVLEHGNESKVSIKGGKFLD
jgi:hypothetical protein